MDPILDDLNEQQRAAVLHGSGPLLILAGAGSGKTRAITRRVARLLRDGEPPESILALTFTNKAAGEMAERIEALGGWRVHVATFHSACARFLRRDAERIGFPGEFTIYDTYDRDVVLKNLLEEFGADAEALKPSVVGRRISELKNRRLRPADVLPDRSELDRVVARLYGPYQQRLKAQGAMDFDDLLLHFVDLLAVHPDVAARHAARIRWLLIDEFQDTNPVQYEIARRLSAGTRNLCVVGDPDQSIYRFRGAEPRNLLQFELDHPDAVTLRLETNYRSTKKIVRAAEQVIRHNKLRLDKDLRTDNEPGQDLATFVASNAQEEAREIAQRIAGLLLQSRPDEVAVFYRTHFQSRALEEACRRHGIPYEVVGGLSFYERREIKDLIAYLRVASNPLDDVSFERIVNVPTRGIGKVTLERLRGLARQHRLSLREAAGDPELLAQFSGKPRQALAALAALLGELAEAGRRSVAEALALLLDRTDYVEHACRFGELEDQSREENIEELISDVAIFDSEQGGGIGTYLGRVALLTSEDRLRAGEPRVSLMTVHAAKGLEFDHVFVAGLEAGLFPHSRSLDSAEDLEEERRLFYVALTRARQSLTLSHAQWRMFAGSEAPQVPSQFLGELPDDCVDRAAAPWRSWALDPERAAPEEGSSGFTIGDRVWHEHYGSGTVLHLSGRMPIAKAQVRFDDGAERQLLLDYAGLQRIDPELGA
jgi:DNA helicase-2/ATP-dependent DNA helicase PcrA